jgi:hypothetical protein
VDFVAISVGGVVGLIVGFALAKMLSKPGQTKTLPVESSSEIQWWKQREMLTGTQLQILQYLETKKSASITQLQEKFSFIPDRELYYRLEQIVLMRFVLRGRLDDQVIYELNPDYSSTVEDDKTVMLSSN